MTVAHMVLYESAAAEDLSLELLRMLQALPLFVVPYGQAAAAQSCRSSIAPIVTLGACPRGFASLRTLGPRGWIAVLPPEEGMMADFVEAGAFVVLRLPIERSVLLSAVSRCLCSLEAESGGDYGETVPNVAQDHADAAG